MEDLNTVPEDTPGRRELYFCKTKKFIWKNEHVEHLKTYLKESVQYIKSDGRKVTKTEVEHYISAAMERNHNIDVKPQQCKYKLDCLMDEYEKKYNRKYVKDCPFYNELNEYFGCDTTNINDLLTSENTAISLVNNNGFSMSAGPSRSEQHNRRNGEPSLENIEKTSPSARPGCKRPWIDSASRPSSPASKARKLAIVSESFPYDTLSKEESVIIQEKILDIINETPLGSHLPKIAAFKFEEGAFKLFCSNAKTVDWVRNNFHGNELVIKDKTLKVLNDANELPKLIKVSLKTKDVYTDPQKFVERIDLYHPNLKANRWQLRDFVDQTFRTYTFEVDTEAAEAIKERNCTVSTGLDFGIVKILHEPKKEVSVERGKPQNLSQDATMEESGPEPFTQASPEHVSDYQGSSEHVSDHQGSSEHVSDYYCPSSMMMSYYSPYPDTPSVRSVQKVDEETTSD